MPSCLRAIVVVVAAACLASTALTAAAQQQPQTRPGWPCVGRPDSSMVQVSEASGGQVFLLDPSELASSATLLMARDGHDETLRRIVGDLDAGLRSIEVAVDPSVDRLLFSVSLQCLQQIEIVRPSGAPVAASDAGVSWTAFQAGRQVGVTAPEPGTWTVRLAGKGLLFLVVHARAVADIRWRAAGAPGRTARPRGPVPRRRAAAPTHAAPHGNHAVARHSGTRR